MSPSDRLPCTVLIPIFIAISGVAFLASAGGFLYSMVYIRSFRSFSSYCDEILFFMFEVTAIYLFVYVIIVMMDRVYGQRSTGGENFVYIVYGIAVGGFALFSFFIKFSIIRLPLLEQLSPHFATLYRVVLPSMILSVLLLIFDIAIISSATVRAGTHRNDIYWREVFLEGAKLDFVILLGFLLMAAILFAVYESKFEVSLETLTIFITGSEIMLFLASTCVFTLHAAIPFFSYRKRGKAVAN